MLIGSRAGGIYSQNPLITITQKEYQYANELAQKGVIKKLLVFVRKSVWDIREDRRSLQKYIENEILKDEDLKSREEQLKLITKQSINHEIFPIFNFATLARRKLPEKFGQSYTLNSKEIVMLKAFATIGILQGELLSLDVITVAINAGVYLKYNNQIGKYNSGNIQKALLDMVLSIKGLNRQNKYSGKISHKMTVRFRCGQRNDLPLVCSLMDERTG